VHYHPRAKNTAPLRLAGLDETDDPVSPKQDTLTKLTETLQRETEELQRLTHAAELRAQKPATAHPARRPKHK